MLPSLAVVKFMGALRYGDAMANVTDVFGQILSTGTPVKVILVKIEKFKLSFNGSVSAAQIVLATNT